MYTVYAGTHAWTYCPLCPSQNCYQSIHITTQSLGVIDNDKLAKCFKHPQVILDHVQKPMHTWFAHIHGILFHSCAVSFACINAERQLLNLFTYGQSPENIVLNFYDILEF